MLRTLNHYAQVYKRFISNNTTRALSFRINFILLLFVDLAFYGSSFGSVSFIFDHVDMIGPWNRNQFLFFVSFMMAVDQLHMVFFAMSFWELSSDLKQGKLDFSLIKPIGIFFPVFFRHIRIGSMLVLPVPWYAMWYFGDRIDLSILDYCFIPFLVLFALAFLLVIEILMSAAMFWTFEGTGINFIRMQLQSLSRWPIFIYGYIFQKIFTFVIPMLLVGSAPVQLLIDSSKWQLSLIMLALFGIFVILTNLIWKIAIRRYESASS